MSVLAKCPHPQTLDGVLVVKLTGSMEPSPLYDAWVKGAGAGLACGQQNGHDHGYFEAQDKYLPLLKGLLGILNRCTGELPDVGPEDMTLLDTASKVIGDTP
ncbi:hypothetical protein LCGC14_1627020 [marine sediment metagenome]|uniref:Uncharacterized protein n=1 Tax=marine sediment metagenome TaxID=412755 RepID=A0A0F9IQS5_9ZZZZ